MVMDANLILRGEYSDALVDADNGDTAAISLTVQSTGNAVVDVKKTGLSNPMYAVLVMTEAADSDSYDDDTVLVIQESDALDRNWQTVVTFPTLHSHIRKIKVKASTAAFVAADITKSAQGGTTGDTGQLLYFDPALATLNGEGYLYIEMDAAGDLFDDVDEQIEITTGTGTGDAVALGAATEAEKDQMQPNTFVRAFHTNKRYVRCYFSTIEDCIGKCWVYLTNAHPSFNTPLGC